jgi:Fe-S cluster biogenesis protein NfuA
MTVDAVFPTSADFAAPREAEKTGAAPAALAEAVAAAIAELRPVLNRDGGDIELVRIEGDLVVIDLKGTCMGCVLSQVTLAGVRKRIVERVGRPLKVVPRHAFVALGRMKAAQ